ncbi:MAG: acyltransferase [Oscillospiraceae bacterium]|nr:acyltransferase [Oscillospiraceae bacterium]
MSEHFYVGNDVVIQQNCIVGLKYNENCGPVEFKGKATVRAGSIMYGDITCGDDFQTGHNVTIRERTLFGDHIVIGTNTVIDGNVTIGDFVKIETNCYLPTHVTIGSRVFIGPGVTMTNDRYPQKMRDSYVPEGPIIEDGVTLGGGSVIVPGLRIGKGSFIAAGAIVTKDVPPMSFVKGAPGVVSDLPEKLREMNMAVNWRKYLED